jgi:hypothetical protein
MAAVLRFPASPATSEPASAFAKAAYMVFIIPNGGFIPGRIYVLRHGKYVLDNRSYGSRCRLVTTVNI